MPYIKKKDRESFEIGPEGATNGIYFGAKNTGELNYCFTKLLLDYLETKGLSYSTCNDIIGALEACKQEFYRRVVVPYEDKKIKENGDCY